MSGVKGMHWTHATALGTAGHGLTASPHHGFIVTFAAGVLEVAAFPCNSHDLPDLKQALTNHDEPAIVGERPDAGLKHLPAHRLPHEVHALDQKFRV